MEIGAGGPGDPRKQGANMRKEQEGTNFRERGRSFLLQKGRDV